MNQNSSQTNYFVTGGAGFIGSHLVDKLMEEVNKVTVYDNLVSGRREWLEHHFGKNDFRFIQADLLDSDTLVQEIKGHDVVWHLAANTDIPTGNKITNLDLDNGIIATRNVLEAMRRHDIDKIVFASAASVYGDVPLVPLSETFGPLFPISLYGAAKLACEGLLTAYSHLSGIKAWMFRFGNVVGFRMGHRVIFDFINKLKQNPKELEILGDGNQEKNFFLVEDCIDGMLYAFRNSTKQYDVFNLGCNSTIKVSAIAQIVVEEMGLKNVRFKYTGGKRGWPGDAPYVMFDTGKMERLGWKARYTSEEAVRIATRRLLDKSP